MGNTNQNSHGMTILELVMVTVVIMVAAVLAYPSLTTFTKPASDRAALQRVVNAIAFGRTKSKRLNRAVVLEMTGMSQLQPDGAIEVSLSEASNCALAAIQQDEGVVPFVRLRRVPFGQANRGDFQGDDIPLVGLAGWRNQSGSRSENPLVLCAGPEGGIYQLVGATAEPIPNQLAVLVQVFESIGDAVVILGPPREVLISFSGAVRERR